MGEDIAHCVEKRYEQLEAELWEMRQQNKGLNMEIQQQVELVQHKRLRAAKRTQAQVQDFANLIAELIAGRCRPEMQFKGMWIGVKVQKLDNYDSGKHHSVDTWLF